MTLSCAALCGNTCIGGCISDRGGGRGCRNDTLMVGVFSVLASCALMSAADGESVLMYAG